MQGKLVLWLAGQLYLNLRSGNFLFFLGARKNRLIAKKKNRLIAG